MMFAGDTLVQAAALGPAAAGVVWLLLSPWPVARRIGGGLLALAAHVAAWAVLWRLYSGEAVSWRGLEPDLLRASIVAFAQIGILLAATRAERLPSAGAAGAMIALGVATSAMTYGAYATGLVTLALLVPVTTLAAAAAGLTGSGRRDLGGIAGLAAADVLVVAGLSMVLARTGSTVLGPAGGHDLGTWVLLLGAAAKAGAIPGIGTWRLAATGGPGAPVAAVIRGQGIALLVVAGPGIAGVEGSVPVAAGAALLAFACGAAGLRAARASGALSAVTGVGACIPFLALGLGGAVGFRAFLTAAPAFLLAAGAAFAVAWAQDPPLAEPSRPPRGGRWLGAATLAVAGASLVGLPPGGGFPGTWLALDLAAVRAEVDPWTLALAGLTVLGLLAAALAAVPLLRAVRPKRLPAALAALVAGALLYMGAAPVRLGIGWFIRIERAGAVPELLPASGAPGLPGVPGGQLLTALVPAAAIVLLVVLLGRGLRGSGTDGFAPLIVRREPRGLLRRAAELRAEAERLFLGVGLAMLLEIGVIFGLVRLVLLGAHQGFL